MSNNMEPASDVEHTRIAGKVVVNLLSFYEMFVHPSVVVEKYDEHRAKTEFPPSHLGHWRLHCMCWV